MLISILTLTLIGLGLGLLLSAASRLLPSREDPLVAKVNALLPGTQCGQCGYAGCAQAAAALVDGSAPLNLCPPGGPAIARQLAQVLERPLAQPTPGGLAMPSLARVIAEQCIGCTKCLQNCPTDAIVGAPKQLHMVLEKACTGCGACVEVCPTEGIQLQQQAITLGNWRWSKPPRPNPFRGPLCPGEGLA
ncbi:RnfABCDGE type electron transport complex subunit B [Motiliproteus sp. SC1-56]|uniref:RnfABCDGE type electron transport complex subunit B n=1 Tax=Motiliproteus sp. SC1-56 TaxID=2799565 RepID=UPI001A8D0E7D|nr:RnfABCDGE type electron transport complex subunit B [Motiliproteus sp. SC1-56]